MQNTQSIKKMFFFPIKFIRENYQQKCTFFALCLGRKAEQGHMLSMLPQFMENSCKIMSFCSVLGDVGLTLYSQRGAFSAHTNYSH